ncbi:MAG: sigma-70 family RNA polymerase sigma factor [Candidatus Poribacteria bacterium]|nr:sigma-70 family RNA polymerase sigma factor [Candidatus Poribacteria bacterium]
MTAEEEQFLAREGSDEARDKLVVSNLRLVKSMVLKFSGCGLEAMDLFGSGVTGLVKAATVYLPSRGRLAPFACPHIRGEILNYIDTFRTAFHIPEPLRCQVNQYRAVCQKLDGTATETEVAEALGWCVEQVRYVRECSDHQQMSSLDALPTDPDGDITLRETLAIASDINAFETSYDLEVYLGKVPHHEAEVLRLRYGVGVPEALSVRAVADRLGMSRSSVSRMEHDALEKLRELARQGFSGGSF